MPAPVLRAAFELEALLGFSSIQLGVSGNTGYPYFRVLIIGILLFRVLY